MPPAHNDHASSCSSPAASFAPRQGSPHYPTGQDKIIPDRTGHQQAAVTAAKGKMWRLTTAASSTESVLTMKSSPHRFHSQGLPKQFGIAHCTQRPAGSTSSTSQRAALPRHRATAHRHAQANSVCNGTAQG